MCTLAPERECLSEQEKVFAVSGFKERGICNNWTTLMRRIRERNFPVGVKLGANTRAWPEAEIDALLASLPAAFDEKGGES